MRVRGAAGLEQWAGQLGDGRAINLGESVGPDGRRWELQLKVCSVPNRLRALMRLCTVPAHFHFLYPFMSLRTCMPCSTTQVPKY